MARSRNIKPALFKNELLGESDPLLTILFCGLWCLADREGRLEDRPKRVKAEIFPYRDSPDINGALTELEQLGFIDRYEVEGQAIIQVVNFNKHQSPHKTEKASELPPKPVKPGDSAITGDAPLNNGEITDEAALIPDSLNLIPDSLNLNSDSLCGGKRANKNPRFKPPEFQEVHEYCLERKNDIDAQYFIDYYQARDWKLKGGQKMKDWKAAIRTWEQNGLNNKGGAGGDFLRKHTSRDWAGSRAGPPDGREYGDF